MAVLIGGSAGGKEAAAVALANISAGSKDVAVRPAPSTLNPKPRGTSRLPLAFDVLLRSCLTVLLPLLPRAFDGLPCANANLQVQHGSRWPPMLHAGLGLAGLFHSKPGFVNPAQSEVVKAHALVGLNQLLLGGTPSGQAAGAAFAARLAPSPAFQKSESRAGLVVNLANLLGQPAAATRIAAAGAAPGACPVDCGLCNSLTTPRGPPPYPCVMLVFLT